MLWKFLACAVANIPRFQDYDDDDPEIDFRRRRWEYWSALKKVRQEYLADLAQLDGQFDAYDFETYITENYGVRLNIVDGNITDGYQIIDEKKYLVFLLKFQ